jgi:hypothetical protein
MTTTECSPLSEVRTHSHPLAHISFLHPLHADACAQLKFNFTITLIVIGKEHRYIFSSEAEGG